MKRFITLFILAVVAISCDMLGGEVDKAGSLTFEDGTDATASFKAKGGSATYKFTADLDWAVTTSAEWISVTPDSGVAGDGQIKIKVEENEEPKVREGYADIKLTNNKSFRINVEQEAAEVEEEPVFELGDNGEYVVKPEGGEVEVEVTTNLDYEVYIPAEASWITYDETRAVRTETVVLVVAENTTTEERVAVIELRGDDGEALEEVTIKQEAAEKTPSTEVSDKEIWYTSTDGKVVTPNNNKAFDADIVSNTYVDGKGIITFDGDVTSIGYMAFYQCATLKTVTIPDSVTAFGEEAFSECTSLEIIYCMPTTPPTLDDGVFYLLPEECVIYVPAEAVEAYKSAEGWDDYAGSIVGYDFEKGEVVNPSPTPGDIDWAVAGSFNNFADMQMLATDVDNLYVAYGINMVAYDRFKIKSITRDWNLNLGATDVYNIYPNSYIDVVWNENLGVDETTGYDRWSAEVCRDINIVEAGTYDIYFYCDAATEDYRVYVVAAGKSYTDATEQTENGPDQEVVPVEGNWSVVGAFNGWNELEGVEMVFDADEDAYVARDVIFEPTITHEFKFVLNNSWDVSIGIGEGETLVLGEWMTSYTPGVNISVDAGTYNIYLSADASQFKVVELENNVPVDPSLAWAVSGIFTNWEPISMSATGVDNLYVFAGAKIGAYERFQIVSSEATLFGSAFKNVYADRWVDAYLIADGASALYVIEEGVYDIYFYADAANADYKIYLMSAGVPYTEATEQTENGPDQEVAGGGYKIYLYKANAWNTVNLYAWHYGTQNTILNAWPGKAYDGTEVFGDYTYYYWEMPAAANDIEDMMIIFNDGSEQTADYGPYTLSSDLYFLLGGTEVTPIDDPENPIPGGNGGSSNATTEEYGDGAFEW